jgi:hypothetical protein
MVCYFVNSRVHWQETMLQRYREPMWGLFLYQRADDYLLKNIYRSNVLGLQPARCVTSSTRQSSREAVTKEKCLTNQGPYMYKTQFLSHTKSDAYPTWRQIYIPKHAHTHSQCEENSAHSQCEENTFLDVNAGGRAEELLCFKEL